MQYFNRLPSTQFGFRKSKSCMDNISTLYLDILSAFKHNAAMLAVFLDTESAYDNVLSDILIEKLTYLSFPSNILAFIFNLVSSRLLNDVIVYSRSVREAIGTVRTSLLRIDAFLKLSGLALSPSKTNFVKFERKGYIVHNDRGHRERRIRFN